MRLAFHVVDGVDQQARLARFGRLQQVEPRRIAVEHVEIVLAQHVDQVRVVVEHRDLDARGKQQARDDLSHPAQAGDDDARAMRFDHVGLRRWLVHAGAR